jgi:hypothetical protein
LNSIIRRQIEKGEAGGAEEAGEAGGAGEAEGEKKIN